MSEKKVWVKYNNVESHTVMDGTDEYVFKENSVLEIPERVARYITHKFPLSFTLTSEPKKIKEKDIFNLKASQVFEKSENADEFEDIEKEVESKPEEKPEEKKPAPKGRKPKSKNKPIKRNRGKK